MNFHVIRSLCIRIYIVIQLYWLQWHAYHYMCVYCVENVLTVFTYAALNVTEILMTWIDSVDIHYVSLSFLKLFSDWKLVNVMTVMTVYTVLCKSHKHQCLHVDSVDKQHSIHNTQKYCFDPLYWPSRHENEEATVPFNVHTTDKVTMSVGEWLSHYLIRSRSHSISKS